MSSTAHRPETSARADRRGLRAVLLAGLLATPQIAAADFTFKRARPPQAGVVKRIDVQIDEVAFAAQSAPRPGWDREPLQDTPPPPPPLAAGDAPLGTGVPSDAQAWFWDTISPGIAPVPGRFTAAAGLAARPPDGSGIAAPSVARLREIARAHGRAILARSVGTRVSPALVLALIAVESAGRADAVSGKGATGLMQLIPATAQRFGVGDARDPAENIRGGIAYLDWLMNAFGDDPVLALAGYNAGEGAVQRYGGVPPFAETRAYVPKVLAAWNVARLMCLTPPQLPGDGCVFEPSLTGI